MTLPRLLGIATIAVVAMVAHVSPAVALPTMIRLGYAGCASCHYAPQGGGPLNPYGKGIDEAQSLRAGEYQPRDGSFLRTIGWGGRIAQDLRLVAPMQRAFAAHQPSAGTFRPRLMYRNVTALPKGFSIYAVASVETDAAPRPSRSFDPSANPSTVFVNSALVRYRATPGLEVAVGRDQLPTGVNISDLASFIKARNRLGYYDAPTQVKVNWAGTRHQLTPFVYGPGGNEADGERESGGGALAEVDLFGKQKHVVGLSVLRGSARNGDRQAVGGYARLGFGSWGILAQHDVTDRTRPSVRPDAFRQHATFGQVFWAQREWLVWSAIGERLTVARPFEERLAAGRLEVAARLSSVATVGIGAKVQRDQLTRRVTTSLLFQMAIKSVH